MTTRALLVLTTVIGLGLLALPGCGRRQRPEQRPERGDRGLAAPGARASERRDDARDEAVEDRTGWEKLGERVVHGKGDRDRIMVTAREGTFRRIMLSVEHSALELFDVEVTFGDGDTFSPGTRLVFGKNSRSRVIDLPGAARVIRKVEFRYGNLPGGGRAQVELWAR